MRARDRLRATWSKRERDVMIHFPLGENTSADCNWLSMVLNRDFAKELERRGYDVTTLRFSIAPRKGNTRFASQRGADGIETPQG